jgi:hypothetical protein
MEIFQFFTSALIAVALIAEVGIPMIEGTWEVIKEAANVY